MQSAPPVPTVFYYDVSAAVVGLSDTERYDLYQAVFTLQGVVNKEAPRLFVRFHSDDNNADETWLSRIREPGGPCADWTLQPVASFEELVRMFRSYINGVVVYDEDVISTSLTAATACGVENGMAVRYDDAEGSMYRYLVSDVDGPQIPVLIDLVGKFTGSGTIWQTSTPSTWSAKCDAYLWAKEKYLDSGRCDPTVLSYTLDAFALQVRGGLDKQTQLSNLDYAVKMKGFCFELSPWGDEIPNDDRTQPLGTDLNTFKAILDACNAQIGQGKMIQLCGFPNWAWKYTDRVGGAHAPVSTEWEFARLCSAYNTYMEGDALGLSYVSNCSFYNGLLPELKNRRYVQNPPPSYADLRARGFIDENGQVADGQYVLLGMGDYDQASWMLYWVGNGFYNDAARGQVGCSWALNPNMMDRIPVAFDYMYRNKTPADYFICWESGAGYVNPAQLRGTRSPSGYPSAVSIWQAHCRKYYRTLDYSISGWLLNGSAPALTATDIDAYVPFSGDGIGLDWHGVVTYSIPQELRSNVPVSKGVRDLDRTLDAAAKAAKIVEDYDGGVDFDWYRTVLWSPSDMAAVQGELDSPHHLVDAYTFYYLLRHHLGGQNTYRATWVEDKIPRIMAAGQDYSVTVTVRNDGWDAWTETSMYRLAHAIVDEGAVAENADYDGRGRAYLSDGVTIASGQCATFSFTVTAPSEPGVYDLYYDMVRDGKTWFRSQHNIEWKKQISRSCKTPFSSESHNLIRSI